MAVRRPLEVTVMSILFSIETIIAIMGIFQSFSIVLGFEWIRIPGILTTFLYIISTCVFLVSAIGLLLLKKWAYDLAIGAAILSIIIFGWIGIIIGIVCLLLLFKKNVKITFGKVKKSKEL